MDIRPVERPEGSAVMRFDLHAERLRMKGQKVRITHFDGEVSDYVVDHVSMPDESGAVTIHFVA